MDNVGCVSHLPAIIVQGRHDVICPPATAYKLAAKWGENVVRLSMRLVTPPLRAVLRMP